jgi:hypothetical protein
MKKHLLLITLLSVFFQTAEAQMVQKGSSFFQLGYGFPSAMQFIGKVFKFGYSMEGEEDYQSSFSYKGFGPMHLRYEYLLGGRVGLGLSANGELGNFKFTSSYTDFDENLVTSTTLLRITSINAMARMNFHFLKRSEKVDLYYGFSAGYSHTRLKLQETLEGADLDPEYQKEVDEVEKYLNDIFKMMPVAFESVFGARFALAPGTGLYFEVGYAKALAQIGFFTKLGGDRGYNRSRWQWF